MCSSSFLSDSIPFLLSLVYVALAPWLDGLTWRSAYERFYEKNDYGIVAPEDLANGAAWAVNVSQVVPAVLLTEAGVLLSVDPLPGWVAALALIGAAVPLAFVGWVHRREKLHDPDDLHLWAYSLPQLAVVAANVVAIVILAA